MSTQNRKLNQLRAIRERELVRDICNAPVRDNTAQSRNAPSATAAAALNKASGVVPSHTASASAATKLAAEMREDPTAHFAAAAAALQRSRTLPQQQPQPPVSLVPALAYFVPTLGELCAQTLANSFADIRAIDQIADPFQYNLIIDQVPTDMPLEVAVPRITADSYWRECCQARFSLGQLPEVTKTNRVSAPAKGGWRRVYLERDMEEFYMGLKIQWSSKDEEALQQKLALCGPHIFSLKLFRQRAHFDVVDLFAKIPHLESFSVSYGVLNAKDAVSPDMLGIKQQDAVMFKKVLEKSQCLTHLALRECGIDDVLGLMICSGLVKNKTLASLDLSHNRIGNDTAHALALLLYNGESLKELYLTNNDIRDRGAASLSRSLTVNNSLLVLDLRLNRIEDAGGDAMLGALANNTCLLSLDLSANHLGPDAARAARDALPSNQKLKKLSLSCNAFGEEGGRFLAHGVEHSSECLEEVEIRESGMAPEEIEAIGSVTQRRRDERDREMRDEAEREQRDEIARIVADKIRKTHGVL